MGAGLSTKGDSRSEPACSDTTSALWTPTLGHTSAASSEGDQRALMNPEEESRPRKADGDALQMTAKGGALLPPWPDSLLPPWPDSSILGGGPNLHLTSNEEEDELGDIPLLSGQSWSSEDLSLEDTTLTTEETTVVGASVEGDFDDLSWTADKDWKFDFTEGLGLDVPRPERFEEVENPTGSWTTDGDDVTKV